MILTDEEVQAIYKSKEHLSTYDQLRAIEAAILKRLSEQEPCCYGNQTALDNMLDDRVAEVAGMRDGWRKTPLYLHPAPPPECNKWKEVADQLADALAIYGIRYDDEKTDAALDAWKEMK